MDAWSTRNTKEYIFGMLFLKRLSDLFDQEREQLAKDLKARGMLHAAIATQLDNPDQYTFFVPDEARWSSIRHLKTNVGSALNKAFAIRWLCAPTGTLCFHSRANNAIAQASINQTDVKRLRVIVPDGEEQLRITRRADHIDGGCDFEIQSLQKLRHLRDRLMHDLLSGRVRVAMADGGAE